MDFGYTNQELVLIGGSFWSTGFAVGVLEVCFHLAQGL